MKRNLTKFFNLIKNSKQVKFIFIFNLVAVFILLLGNSLSIFTRNNSSDLANIKVNNLLFNMTTNSGESDDRILHLKAGKLESFKIVLTNLNNLDTKYELIYELCNDSKCTSTSTNIPSMINVYKETEGTKINGDITAKNNTTIIIVTKNNSNDDYYIKLNISAGYLWNDLALTNQINEQFDKYNDIPIVSYVDGQETSDLPSSCAYLATMKIYKKDVELTADNIEITCNSLISKWSINFEKMINIPDKIEIYFKTQKVIDYDFIASTTDNSEPYYTFVAPKDGTYKLETWGAQGGNGHKNNVVVENVAYGGYSTGIVKLNKGDKVYVYVGGRGSNGVVKVNNTAGGYNGGGKGHWDKNDDETSGGGGGATHIAKVTGLLSTLSDNVNNTLIVSGGGGGVAWTYVPGMGGGMSGTEGYKSSSVKVNPGTQTSGAAFGQGGDGVNNTGTPGGGGGGGFYGGFGGNDNGVPGAGGSGYIGNSELTNKAMYCYNCEESTDEATYTINTLGPNDTLDKTSCPDGYSAEPISKCAKSGNGHARVTALFDIPEA